MTALPKVPAGTGEHPIMLVAISATALDASSAFYAKLFGWQPMRLSAEVAAVGTPGGPSVSLRSNLPASFPGSVPMIGTIDVDATLARLVAAGATVEKATWSVPMVGKLARFRDPSGALYGLTDGFKVADRSVIPMPVADNPKPPVGAICHVEMYASDGNATAAWFGARFGWGTLATMPQYVAFDPGAGVGGIFQSHSPNGPAVPYIYVNDVPAMLTSITAEGGSTNSPPMVAPGMGTFGYFNDPSGTSMGLIGP